jgi:hypothetical protein
MDTKDGGVGAMVDAIYEAFVQFAVMEVREVFEAFRSDRDAVGELYLYRMGDVTKPLVVVHADTVFCRPPKRQEVEREGMIVRRRLGSKEGLGADDRLGVALLWLLLKEFPQTAFLITDKEEQHQKGALVAARDLVDELARYPFLLQLDRKGTQHFAHYGHVTSEFMQALRDITGFDFEKGSRTDITVLCPRVRRCGANMAIGYYKPHTAEEYVNLEHASIAYEALRKIMSKEFHEPFVWRD